jgi:hypothetical protein
MADSSVRSSDKLNNEGIPQGALAHLLAKEAASGVLQDELQQIRRPKPEAAKSEAAKPEGPGLEALKPEPSKWDVPARAARQAGAFDAPSNSEKGGLRGNLSDWNERHDALAKKAQSTNPDVAFYGDSITEAMHLNNSFNKLFDGKAENFGIHSDTTDNLRYRLLNGEASFANGKNPKDVVMLIGTNDLGKKSAGDIANDIYSDAMLVHKKLPESKLLVLGLLPRPGFETDISEVNRILGERVRNQNDSSVRFKDIGSSMPEGAPGIWQPGGVHPTFGAGYTRMLTAIKNAMDDRNR